MRSTKIWIKKTPDCFVWLLMFGLLHHQLDCFVWKWKIIIQNRIRKNLQQWCEMKFYCGLEIGRPYETQDLSEKMTFKKSNYIQISFYFWSFFLFFQENLFSWLLLLVLCVFFSFTKYLYLMIARGLKRDPQKN